MNIKSEPIIPAEEMLPQGYTEYLLRILEANMENGTSLNASENFYLLVRQRMPNITYAYMNADGTEIPIRLLY